MTAYNQLILMANRELATLGLYRSGMKVYEVTMEGGELAVFGECFLGPEGEATYATLPAMLAYETVRVRLLDQLRENSEVIFE